MSSCDTGNIHFCNARTANLQLRIIRIKPIYGPTSDYIKQPVLVPADFLFAARNSRTAPEPVQDIFIFTEPVSKQREMMSEDEKE